MGELHTGVLGRIWGDRPGRQDRPAGEAGPPASETEASLVVPEHWSREGSAEQSRTEAGSRRRPVVGGRLPSGRGHSLGQGSSLGPKVMPSEGAAADPPCSPAGGRVDLPTAPGRSPASAQFPPSSGRSCLHQLSHKAHPSLFFFFFLQ